jgi:primosomal protein N' (replication factor Y) (superfamily II helicase)
MIKSTMHYFDVLFPINLDPLTYTCDEPSSALVQPGMVIEAPLRNKLTRGIVLGRNLFPPKGPVKEFRLLPGEPAVLGKSLLKLIKWMSDYYIMPEGMVLKQTIPPEFLKRIKARKSKPRDSVCNAAGFVDIETQHITDISSAVKSGAYSGFLMHAPSVLYEYSMVLKLLSTATGIIVLLPDTGQADLLYSAAREAQPERVCLLHGDLSAGRRSENTGGILSGRYDIVIGTRAALFAPMKKVSLVIVLNEHSSYYKIEDAVRYNVRDVAVMRAFMEKAVVLLTSISPSIESYFNSVTGKYRLMRPFSPAKRPEIKIADMQYEKKIKPDLSQRIYESAKKHIRKNNRVLFIINRLGYSSLLICNDCRLIIKCPSCDIPMSLNKDRAFLKCRYCSSTQPVPETCPGCKGHNFELLGSGSERFQEYLEELFGKATMRFDSETVKTRSEKEDLARLLCGDYSRILIGTKMLTGRLTFADKYSMAAVLNIDSALNLPDFRAMEKGYQELSSIIDLVEPSGEVLIQTRFAKAPLFTHLRGNDYVSFAREELSVRKGLNFPPYMKLLKITFTGPPALAESIVKIIRTADPKMEILGPAEEKGRRGTRIFSLMLKSSDRKALNKAARRVLNSPDHPKEAKIRVDVDPV